MLRREPRRPHTRGPHSTPGPVTLADRFALLTRFPDLKWVFQHLLNYPTPVWEGRGDTPPGQFRQPAQGAAAMHSASPDNHRCHVICSHARLVKGGGRTTAALTPGSTNHLQHFLQVSECFAGYDTLYARVSPTLTITDLSNET